MSKSYAKCREALEVAAKAEKDVAVIISHSRYHVETPEQRRPVVRPWEYLVYWGRPDKLTKEHIDSLCELHEVR